MKEEIIKLSKSIGIDEIGFCSTKNLVVDYNKYKIQEKLNYKCPFQVGDISDKDLSNSKYEKYNTVICICLGYKKIEMNNPNKVYVCSMANNKDYHKVLNDKLSIICNYLEKLGYENKIFVDNNALDEKLLAYNCGIGFFGKNSLLINKKLGSCFNIGIILTSAIIESDNIVNLTCGKCDLCIKACPRDAINESGILNSKKCLSYLTQKKKLENGEDKYLNNCIYGCDKCISICPYNKSIEFNNDDNSIDINNFLTMSDEEFKLKYKDSAILWRGKNVLDRNIKHYLKNIDKK